MHTDVIVIGAGQAGVPLAVRLAGAGKRVLLVEAAELGGTCVNSGCTPTKTMIASARAAHVARSAARLGVHSADVRVDLPAVVERKDAIVRQWRAGVRKKLERAGERLSLVRGRARFVGPREVEVEGARHSGESVIVNVGCRPMAPSIPGLEAAAPLDSSSAMELREVPAHLLVLGGGYIGCEFAQMFRRFGAEVTVVESNDRLLSHEEPEASTALEAAFKNEGIGLELGGRVERISRQGHQITMHLGGGRELHGSHVLVAVGRRPNTDELGCDAAGIVLDGDGFIRVDDGYRTSAPGVYAVGDVTPGPQFTHAAWDDHRILFDLLEGRAARQRGDRIVPITAFTDPQVARVGLTEEQARAKGGLCEVATMPFGHIARAIEVDETAGVLKVVIDSATERVLGATIVGAEAGELIHIFVTLIAAGATCRAIVDAEYVHPTFAEGVQSLVMKIKRYAIG